MTALKNFCIGNYIQYQKTYYQITALSQHGISLKHSNDSTEIVAQISDIKPIKLTQPLLIQLGFKRQDNELPEYEMIVDKKYISADSNNQFSFFGIGIKPDHSINVSYQVNNIYSSRSLQYVHELQNFYFFLTGQELNVNEKQLVS